MSAARLLQRSDWEQRLVELTCHRHEGDRSGLETGEWWVTEHDRLFIVPCDEQGLLRADDWQQIKVQLAKLKPLDWDS